MRSLPNISVQTEFSSYSGDCTQDSFDMAAHCADPSRFPVSAAELDTLTRESIAAGKTVSAQGAMTDADLAWLCTFEQIAYSQVYGVTAGVAAIRQWGGIKPMILQVLEGQLIPGNQGGVAGHAVAVFGYDPTSDMALIGNGDSTAGQAGHPDVVPVGGVSLGGSLQAAQPFCVTILEVSMTTVTPTWDGGAGTLTYPAHDGLPVIVLVHGQAGYAVGNRQGYYPLAPETANGAGDGIVYWSDCNRTRAVKVANWQVLLEVAAEELAAGLAAQGQTAATAAQVAAGQVLAAFEQWTKLYGG